MGPELHMAMAGAVAFPCRAHDHFAIQDCTTPSLKNICTGACEWLIRLLAGGHLRAVTQWPTEGAALDHALDLVVAGLAGFAREISGKPEIRSFLSHRC